MSPTLKAKTETHPTHPAHSPTATPSPDPAPTKGKKSTASKMHRRSRNGCFTCRLRRKKCDEAQPACRACRHLGLACEYKRPGWWANHDGRRQQKDLIKTLIRNTKLTNERGEGRGKAAPVLSAPVKPHTQTPAPVKPHTQTPARLPALPPPTPPLSLSDDDPPVQYYPATPYWPLPTADEWYPAVGHPQGYQYTVKTETETGAWDWYPGMDPQMDPALDPGMQMEMAEYRSHSAPADVDEFAFWHGPGLDSLQDPQGQLDPLPDHPHLQLDPLPLPFHADPSHPLPDASTHHSPPAHDSVSDAVSDGVSEDLADTFRRLAPRLFPVSEARRPGEASGHVLAAMDRNACYRACCEAVAAMGLYAHGAEQGGDGWGEYAGEQGGGYGGEQYDGNDRLQPSRESSRLQPSGSDQLQHSRDRLQSSRFNAISSLCTALEADTDHRDILHATLALIFFSARVAPCPPDPSVPDIPWHQHFQAAVNLVQKLGLLEGTQGAAPGDLSSSGVGGPGVASSGAGYPGTGISGVGYAGTGISGVGDSGAGYPGDAAPGYTPHGAPGCNSGVPGYTPHAASSCIPHAASSCNSGVGLTAAIDIVGATMLGRAPAFADAYRTALIANTSLGIDAVTGCADRVLCLLSEIACLEALRGEGMDGMEVCRHVSSLAGQIDISECPSKTDGLVYETDPTDPTDGVTTDESLTTETLAPTHENLTTTTTPAFTTGSTTTTDPAFTTTTAATTTDPRPAQAACGDLDVTALFRLACRIYLCTLVPGFSPVQPSIAALTDRVADELALAASAGLLAACAWPLLIAGSVALPQSRLRSVCEDAWGMDSRAGGRATDAQSGMDSLAGGRVGSMALTRVVLREVWRRNMQANDTDGCVGWREVMRELGWGDALVI